MELPDDVKARIERNRLAALERKRQKEMERNGGQQAIVEQKPPSQSSTFSRPTTSTVTNGSSSATGMDAFLSRGTVYNGSNATNSISGSKGKEVPSTSAKPGWLNTNKPGVNNANGGASPFAKSSVMSVAKFPKGAVNISPKRVIPTKKAEAVKDQNISGKKKVRIFIQLMSSDHLSVAFANNPFINLIVKKVKSHCYLPDKKLYRISLEDYLPFIKFLKESKTNPSMDVFPEVDATSVPPEVVSSILGAKSEKQIEINLSDNLESDFIEKLYPFQREGVKFGIRKGGRCMIADEMGLGKTVQAIGIAAWFVNDWPLVIVCPASVARVWRKDLLNWLPELVRERDIEILEKPGPFPRNKVVIMSYERMSKCTMDISKAKANFIIFDESHNLKNDSALRTKSAISIAKSVKRVVLLSGTPALSRPIELFPQLQILSPKMFSKKHIFGLRYCDAKPNPYSRGLYPIYDYKGSSNTQELKILIESTVMIRRMKKDVLKELPKKVRSKVDLPLELSDEDKKLMNGYREKLSTMNNLTADSRQDLMAWFVDSAKVKVDAVCKYVGKKLKKNPDKKFIVFTYHHVMSDGLMTFLKDKKVSFVIITGQTDPKLRQECCEYFQSDLRVRVALVSIIAAGIGVTLTAAHHVIFGELFWNPGIINQAEDRAHRIGQTNIVEIEYLISKGTVDELIWRTVGSKLHVLEQVGLGGENMIKASTIRDSKQPLIEDLFKKLTKDEIEKTRDEVKFEDIKEELSILEENDDFLEVIDEKPYLADTNDQPGPSGIKKEVVEVDDDDPFDDDDLDIVHVPILPVSKRLKVEDMDDDDEVQCIDISECDIKKEGIKEEY